MNTGTPPTLEPRLVGSLLIVTRLNEVTVRRGNGEILTLDSVRTQTRPDGTLAWMENTRTIVRYRRVR